MCLTEHVPCLCMVLHFAQISADRKTCSKGGNENKLPCSTKQAVWSLLPSPKESGIKGGE